LALPQAFDPWEAELASMNAGKRGGQYDYPDSFMGFVCNLKDAFCLASRVLQGFLLGLSVYVPGVASCDHATICRRANEFEKPLQAAGSSIIAVDSSGLSPARRGGWLSVKHHKKQEYVKVHIAMNTKTGEILEFRLTPDSVHDSTMFSKLVHVASKKKPVKKVIADGAYDANKCDNEMKKRGGRLVSPPRKNSKFKEDPPPEWEARNARVGEYQRLGEAEWKKKNGYGKRWLVETDFSRLKRLFGEHVAAKTERGVKTEVRRKINLLNQFATL
jgi:transposase